MAGYSAPTPRPPSPYRFIASFGGAWILITGLVWAYLTFTIPVHASSTIKAEIWGEALAGVVAGAVALSSVYWSTRSPDRTRMAGIICVGCAIVSLSVPPSGLLIGPALSLVGGILMMAKPIEGN